MLGVCTELSCLSLAFVQVRVVYLVSTVFGDGSFVRTLRSGLKWLGGTNLQLTERDLASLRKLISSARLAPLGMYICT
jgi:hypothetical protein